MPQPVDLQQALASFDRQSKAFAETLTQAESERQDILARFPLADWPTLPKEKYALGLPGSEDSYCRLLEFKTPHLGSIRGGSARKLILYKHLEKPGWFIALPGVQDENEAWQALRSAFVEAFQLAEAGNWDAIDEISVLHPGGALLLKSLHIYFPQDILPICSRDHIRRFLGRLGQADPGGAVKANRALLAAMKTEAACAGWSPLEIEKFLYAWADPRTQQRVFKISPGEGAKFWDECLAGGYICVGWDEVGDLREFETKEDFLAKFRETHLEFYDNDAATTTRKANELWSLLELEPGDRVVANKGISQVLAIGTVEDPGYEWLSGRQDHRHGVRVKWNIAAAKTIPPQRRWGMTTVAPIGAELYQLIAGRSSTMPPIEVLDPTYSEIQAALEHKGQAILYGPPGTGKTYSARRFAVRWLLEREGRADAQAVLADPVRFAAEEARLSTVQMTRRTWWVVANRAEWSWDELFKTGSVQYRYGRLQRNYPLLQPGDLVLGYQSAPEMQVVALARVESALGMHGETEPTIGLVPVAKVAKGLRYDEMKAAPEMKDSEPVKFRNQGTLFALTSQEADYVLGILGDRNPELLPHLKEGGEQTGVGPLTRLTFHPTYSYEDFVEGFRPVDNGQGLALRLEDGVFKRICREAQGHPNQPYLVLIDEINRANLAKVFGELITLLEQDKRNLHLTLPQSKESFAIPLNVFILGTMNTADRSIKLMDAALRRRFAFVELLPDLALLQGGQVGPLALDRFLEGLNRNIAKIEGREKQIGHSYLLENGQPLTDVAEFARRFRQEILPLLQEYCYDDFGALADYLGNTLVKRDEQMLNTDCLRHDDELVLALSENFGV